MAAKKESQLKQFLRFRTTGRASEQGYVIVIRVVRVGAAFGREKDRS